MSFDSSAPHMALAANAADVEQSAMACDRRGSSLEAAQLYREAAEGFSRAAQACQKGHPDRRLLEEHRSEVLTRACYLEALRPLEDEKLPLEAHINGVHLRGGDVPSKSGERKNIGAAAAVTGAAGLLLLGPVGGIALAAGTAYAATRKDSSLGSAARSLGAASAAAAGRAKAFDEQHHLSEKAVKAASATATKIGHFNEKHKVTERLGKGLSSGVGKISDMMSKGSSSTYHKAAIGGS